MPIILQNILIILLSAWMAWDNGSGGQVLNGWPVTVGLVMGIITGDISTALVIAGTLQLMSLGVAALGGASIPEYGLATIVSIFIAVRTGANTGTAVAIGLPVGMLALQLDVLVKIINNFFAHLSVKFLHEKKYKEMQLSFICSVFVWTLKYVIPVVIVVILGPSIVKSILNFVPEWFTNGLSIAGGMLPVVGVGILMHYMPVKKYIAFIIFGFLMAAYMKLPILAVALAGAACAYILYRTGIDKANKKQSTVEVDGGDYDE